LFGFVSGTDQLHPVSGTNGDCGEERYTGMYAFKFSKFSTAFELQAGCNSIFFDKAKSISILLEELQVL